MKFNLRHILTAALAAMLAGACASHRVPESRTLTLGAYTTPREAFREIHRDFKALWKQRNDEEIEIRESYLGSGAQSRAVVDGFPADVVVLSLEPDVERIVKAGLITHPWREVSQGGILTRSLVAFAVRAGNPKGIRDWADLARPDVEVLSPNPRTSGGAMWNILAAYGAAERGRVAGFPAGSEGGAAYLAALLKRVIAMDKGARESILTFEKGLGDVALSYENEIKVGAAQSLGYPYEMVLPNSTILIENPVALVDKNIERHGNRALAEVYRDYLFSPAAQRVFAKWGFRPVNPETQREMAKEFRDPSDLFTIAAFGGWAKVVPEFFGKEGLFMRLSEQERKVQK
ncbi:MAG: sulfate ABC transporter substrate-binding protein [Deltaproteobacteria bacterium]|nr:sulfate ABC transporter substrate-binding protein [Deltaproteobacteria bacterium]